MKTLHLAIAVALMLLSPQISRAAENKGVDINRPVRDKWALIVGVSKFQNSNIPRLKYAAKDARDFRNFLVNEANFAPDHVRLLLDEDATRRRVLSELGDRFLARVAKPDDLIVLYFSTHGSPAQADVRGQNFIVAYDTDAEELFSTGIEMDKILADVKQRIESDRVLMVLDACHSGAVAPNSKGLTLVGNFDAEKLAQGCGQLVICSSSPQERSWESKRYDNGVFTRKLLDALRLNGKRTTLAQAFPYVQQSVTAEVQEDYAAKQTPNLARTWDGNELVLAAPAAAPQAIPPTVYQVIGPDSTIQKPISVPVGSQNKMDFQTGVSLYKKGDYGSAISFLNAALKLPATNRADAHYYLGSAYYKLNKTEDAIREFRECYKANPKSPNAAYCLSVLNQYGAANFSRAPQAVSKQAGSVTLPAATVGVSSVATSAPSTLSAGQASPASLSKLLAEISSKLPRIPSVQAERPAAAEVMRWTDSELASYYNESLARKERAATRLKEIEDLLKKAESIAYSIVPNAKNYGESAQSFQQRKADGLVAFNDLIAKYRTELDRRTQALAQESALATACLAAKNKCHSY